MKTSERMNGWKDGQVEWMDSGVAEQSWVLPSCLRSVCLCGVWGRLREAAPCEL